MTTDVAPNACTVDGCTGERHALGYCSTHYQRIRRLGTLELPHRTATSTAAPASTTATADARCTTNAPNGRRANGVWGDPLDPHRHREAIALVYPSHFLARFHFSIDRR